MHKVMDNADQSTNNLLHRYPVLSFCILTWLLGGGLIVLIVMSGLPGDLALLSTFSASIAGMLMIAIVDGKQGLRAMFKRLLIWRVHIGYWLFALLFIVVANLAGALVNPLFGGDQMNLSDFQPPFSIALMYAIFFIVAGLGQELGWTGFLLPRLQTRFSALTASILRGIITWVWHLPIYILSINHPDKLNSLQYANWIAQVGLPAVMLVTLLMLMIPWSILFTWLYNNTRGSLLLVVFLHTSEIWTAYLMLSTGINPANLNHYWGFGAVLVITAVLIVLLTKPGDLSRRNNKISTRT